MSAFRFLFAYRNCDEIGGRCQAMVGFFESRSVNV